MTYDNNKRVVDLTLGEVLDAIEARVKQTMSGQGRRDEVDRRMVYGLKGIQQLFNCSKTTASRIKQSGRIDAAISQIGDMIVIDADKALELNRRK